MHCHLLIPGLFPPAALTPANDPLYRAHAAALQTLLARGGCITSSMAEMESWLCETFGVARQQDYPAAPLSAMADGIEAGSGYWLRADPVHLAVERDQLILAESSTFMLSQEESEHLVDTLNTHFSFDGLHFCAPHPLRWYLRMEQRPSITTQTLFQVAGRNIHSYLPHGQDELHWRSLINEIQMLLFEHPINIARESRGEAPINSIWPWGGGTLPSKFNPPFDQVWATDALTVGLAMASKLPRQGLPADAGAWLAQAHRGKHLLVLDELRAAGCYGTPHLWRESLVQLEQKWFAPLEQMLRKGAIELTLHAPTPDGSLSFNITRCGLWKLWRRPRPLMDYRPVESET